MKESTVSANEHVALLRGINVGGKNKLPMKELVAIFHAAGCNDVRTYIQSGNVVFRMGTEEETAGLGKRIATEIEARSGLRVPVILRISFALRRMTGTRSPDRASISVAMRLPSPAVSSSVPTDVQGLDTDRSPGDSFIVSGSEIYLHLPQGVAPSRLTNTYFDKQLGTVSTMRNWRTVVTLAEWMGIP